MSDTTHQSASHGGSGLDLGREDSSPVPAGGRGSAPEASAPLSEKRCHCDIVLNSISEGVFTVGRDMRLTSLNQAAGEILGLDREKALGRSCEDLFCAEMCVIGEKLREAIEHGHEAERLRVSIPLPDSRRVPVEVSVSALRDDQGEALGGVVVFRDLSDVENLRRQIREPWRVHDIVSRSHVMKRLFDMLPDVAASESTVLIEGPSGAGKELLARAVHDLSGRRQGPMVAVNCGALPDTLLESELFGYVKGAFTDARTDKPGRFARADGGTLFLDEIGDISPALQVRLLRVLQEKEFEPLGSVKPRKANVRVVAATHRDLSKLVREGVFREDLFYRINIVRLTLPPLKERREDIPLLVDRFIEKFNAQTGKAVEKVSDEVMAALMAYDFPGNIRELENLIEHAFILCRGDVIEAGHLPAEFLEAVGLSSRTGDAGVGVVAGRRLDEIERAAIEASLARHDGRRAAVAEELGIDKSTLWRKMKRYGID